VGIDVNNAKPAGRLSAQRSHYSPFQGILQCTTPYTISNERRFESGSAMRSATTGSRCSEWLRPLLADRLFVGNCPGVLPCSDYKTHPTSDSRTVPYVAVDLG